MTVSIKVKNTLIGNIVATSEIYKLVKLNKQDFEPKLVQAVVAIKFM